jgi:hypothetical protein
MASSTPSRSAIAAAASSKTSSAPRASGSASAAPTSYAVPSVWPHPAYGRYAIAVDGGACRLVHTGAAGRRTGLAQWTDCWDSPTALLDEVRFVPGLSLPLRTKHGEEFHLFEIPVARGGNATPACALYPVVLRADGAWGGDPIETRQCPSSSPSTFASARLDETGLSPTLELVEAATTKSTGTRWSIQFGSAVRTTLAKLPRTVKSDVPFREVGKLVAPSHASNYAWSLDRGSIITLIDRPGGCALDGFSGGETVTLVGKLRTWSDGETELTCTAVTPKP